MDIILRGILLGLSITAPIGPTNVEIIRRGTREGWKAAAVFCFGVMLALIFYLLLAVFGLSILIESNYVNRALTLLGIVVLGYLAYHSFMDFFTGRELETAAPAESGNRHFIPGVVLTLSNPAVLLLWSGILGAALAANRASAAQGLLLSAGILIGVAVFFTCLTAVIHFGRRFLRRQYFRFVSLAAGIVLGIFCIRFAFNFLTSLLG